MCSSATINSMSSQRNDLTDQRVLLAYEEKHIIARSMISFRVEMLG